MSRSLNRPSFMSPIYAAVRQGAKEGAQILPALPGSVRVVEEPGTLANPTQQMVTEESGTLRNKQSILDRYNSRAYEREGREMEIER